MFSRSILIGPSKSQSGSLLLLSRIHLFTDCLNFGRLCPSLMSTLRLFHCLMVLQRYPFSVNCNLGALVVRWQSSSITILSLIVGGLLRLIICHICVKDCTSAISWMVIQPTCSSRLEILVFLLHPVTHLPVYSPVFGLL